MASKIPNAKEKVSPVASQYRVNGGGSSRNIDIVRDEIFSWWNDPIGE